VALRRTVPFLRFRIISEILNQLRVVNLIGEGINNSVEIDLMAIAGKLYTIRQAVCEVLDKLRSRVGIALAHHPGNRQLTIRIQRYPGPDIASNLACGDLLRYVLLLRIAEAPNLIHLNA